MSSKEDVKQNFMTKYMDRMMGKTQPMDLKDVVLHPLNDMLSDLMHVEEETWGKYAFNREPIRGRFTKKEQKELAKKANECGKFYARKIKEEYADISMLELAKKLGLEVNFPEKPNGGGHIIFAQFVEPNQITIFNDSLRKAEQLIVENGLSELFGQTEVRDILLAHEIFHFIEEQNEQEIFTRTESVCLWKLGPLKNQSKIVCLGEIAGMAFAQELLGLSFSPYVLDAFLVYPYNQQISCMLYEEIMNLNK